jgi:sugar/nucleoside kinase (ribokinase family)
MSKEPLDVVGIGNAIVDILTRTNDDFIDIHQIAKGSMTLIEEDRAETLYKKMGPATEVSGGSVANTIAAFAAMGGKAGYIGKVANDQLGTVFRHDICAAGVAFDTPALSDGPSTARCLILVTPDAQRTMCTYLGACVWLTPADIDAARELIERAEVTYLEGYLFDKPHAKQAFLRACEIAHNAGRKVALSLSDSFCVNRHREEFLSLVEEHVDILFANEDEIKALYKTQDMNVIVHNLRAHCAIAAVTRSDKGSVVVSSDGAVEVPCAPVARVIDTTGAGDMYAAGFLYGLRQKLPLAECGRLGSLVAGEVIQHMGARPQCDLAALVNMKEAV